MVNTNTTGWKNVDILEQVVDYTCQIIGCDDASVILWNPQKKQFELGAATNNRFAHTLGQRVRAEGGTTRWILDNGQSVMANQLKDTPTTGNTIAFDLGLQSFAGAPIIHDDEPLGVLYALSHSPDSFSPEKVTALEALAQMAAIAIYNARLADNLRDLNSFKDAMMGLAAHDLRNPLSRLLGYFNMLVEDINPLPEMQASFVEQIYYAFRQMEDLIDGILHYERLTQDGDGTRFEEHDLNQLFISASEHFEHELSQKEQSFHFDLTDELMPFHMDVLLLGEALGNIIANASKYSPEGTVITLCSTKRDNEYLLMVQDEGMGIGPQFHEKIFQPFMRLVEAKSQRGSGLGLSLVKTIIERHGGYITLESDVGQGSVFIVHFPAL